MKRILNLKETAELTGFSPNYLYQLVHKGIIPFSKPTNGVLFFDRVKIEDWMLSNSSCPKDREIKASTYVTTH